MIIASQHADDLDRQAQRLEFEAEEYARTGEDRAAAVKRTHAERLRREALKLRRGRAEGVRFG